MADIPEKIRTRHLPPSTAVFGWHTATPPRSAGALCHFQVPLSSFTLCIHCLRCLKLKVRNFLLSAQHRTRTCTY